jgi:hypothetical protein
MRPKNRKVKLSSDRCGGILILALTRLKPLRDAAPDSHLEGSQSRVTRMPPQAHTFRFAAWSPANTRKTKLAVVTDEESKSSRTFDGLLRIPKRILGQSEDVLIVAC